MKKLWVWGGLLCLWGVALFFCWQNFYQVSGFWDDGNLFYPVVALAHGLIPNVDFVHGYPGFLSLLLYAVSWVSGLNLTVFRIVTWVICVAGLSFLYFLAVDVMGLSLAVLAFLWGLSWTFVVFFTLNPAFWVFGITSFCVFYFYRQAKKAEEKKTSISSVTWLLLAVLCGLSMGFKQSGLFNILAFAGLLAWCLRPFSPRWLWHLLRFFLTLGPLFAFCAVRLSSQFSVIPWNSVILLPWCLAAGLAFFSSPTPSLQISFKKFFLFGIICLVSSLSWLLYYIANGISALSILHELFVRVPGLIDRDLSPMNPSWISLGVVACVVLLAVAFKIQRLQDFLNSKLVRGLMLGLYFAFGAGVLALSFFNPSQFSPWMNDMYWNSALVLSIAMGGLLLFSNRQKDIPLKAVFLFCSVALASGYPYINNVVFTNGIFTFTICYLLWKFVVSQPMGKKSNFLNLASTAMIIAGFIHVDWILKQGSESQQRVLFQKIGYNFYSSEPSSMFVLTGEWLARNLPPQSSVGGYPNFALSFALANVVTYSKLPNFIGNQSDYDQIVQDLESGRGPDFFVISPTMYPFVHPYLIPPGRILAALAKGYSLYGQVSDQNKNAIHIYKKN